MNRQLLVADIMTTEVYRVEPAMTVRDAIRTLVRKKITGAPVVDQLGRVLTVVSQGDLLRLAASVGLDKQIAACLDRLSKSLITLDRAQTFQDAYKMFLKNSVHRIIVIDGSGALHGVVSRSDILKHLVAGTGDTL